MSYSACDFADDIYGAFSHLKFPDAEDDEGNLTEQATVILTEIERLQRIAHRTEGLRKQGRRRRPVAAIDIFAAQNAVKHLQRALECLVDADCPQAANRVRHALKSAEGAVRHIRGHCTEAHKDVARP